MVVAVKALRARRDFLVVAAYRRGIPVRHIAKAAGITSARVSQLVAPHLDPIPPRDDRKRPKRV